MIPVFTWFPEEEGPWAPGAASRWWLHHSLRSLDKDLRTHGSRLVFRRGPAETALTDLLHETGAEAVYWNRRYEPALRTQEARVEAALRAENAEVRTFNSALLFEPTDIATKQGTPFRVFTPFWRACQQAAAPPEPLPEPSKPAAPSKWPKSLKLNDLGLEPAVDWAAGLRNTWRPGERGAWERLTGFGAEGVDAYGGERDIPGAEGTSRLSPHLHFGEIGPRQIWHHLESREEDELAGKESFLRQLFWREFAYHILYHRPDTTDHPLRPAFADFPWRHDADALRRWQHGRTGYPLVDAGMRQLWTTGWMHNRVRLAVASFLVKHLLVPWQDGARWFWDTLVDADLANNTMGWQWTAGCGADAAPYFRIFNPVAQGQRFDPEGTYVHRWIPELARLKPKRVHCPWTATAAELSEAGIVLDDTYPAPIVDHAEARARALAAYEVIKGR